MRETIKEIEMCERLEREADFALGSFTFLNYFRGETLCQWAKQKWDARIYRELFLEPQLISMKSYVQKRSNEPPNV